MGGIELKHHMVEGGRSDSEYVDGNELAAPS